ncbi:MAG TPA: hypothetical protein D7H86_07330 [Candidatus Poseidoniales archaeon]|nr:hypothetical protein [Euryarchaeota archaeon]DAC11614.1 MAG TPA: hypothetical protein D7H86_07330 [Candidatus Poseidoniales archaeon]|tara:strand:- start:131 stop:787 length:657 start_codon:yes stop_codon:yes gene_type:complete
MGEDQDAVDERLSVFEDEPDLNDWFEVICGAAMAMIGIFQLMSPGNLINPEVMRWFAAAVICAGAAWAGHGLKDMAVKEVRRSIVMLEMGTKQGSVDYGLIRDVILHPNAYKDFLLKEYEKAFDDGVITDEELDELKAFQIALGISDKEAAEMALNAAIKSALKDGKVDSKEAEMIEKAAQGAGIDDDGISKLHDALADGELDEEDKKLLEKLIEESA